MILHLHHHHHHLLYRNFHVSMLVGIYPIFSHTLGRFPVDCNCPKTEAARHLEPCDMYLAVGQSSALSPCGAPFGTPALRPVAEIDGKIMEKIRIPMGHVTQYTMLMSILREYGEVIWFYLFLGHVKVQIRC